MRTLNRAMERTDSTHLREGSRGSHEEAQRADGKSPSRWDETPQHVSKGHAQRLPPVQAGQPAQVGAPGARAAAVRQRLDAHAAPRRDVTCGMAAWRAHGMAVGQPGSRQTPDPAIFHMTAPLGAALQLSTPHAVHPHASLASPPAHPPEYMTILGLTTRRKKGLVG